LTAPVSYPTVNVFRRCEEASAAVAATSVESTPPLRNTPTGTSATMRVRTDSSSSSFASAATDANDSLRRTPT
jgi:hypothetical protein